MGKKASRSKVTTPATQALQRLGIDVRLHSYDFDPGDFGIGEQAAMALGVEPERIFKTLIVMIDGKRPAVALTPVAAETRLKDTGGGTRRQARRHGRDFGSRAALRLRQGRHQPLRPASAAGRQSLIDPSSDHDSIFVNGGRRGLQIELSPDDLIRALSADLADLAR